jgi:hypothetical protein
MQRFEPQAEMKMDFDILIYIYLNITLIITPITRVFIRDFEYVNE